MFAGCFVAPTAEIRPAATVRKRSSGGTERSLKRPSLHVDVVCSFALWCRGCSKWFGAPDRNLRRRARRAPFAGAPLPRAAISSAALAGAALAVMLTPSVSFAQPANPLQALPDLESTPLGKSGDYPVNLLWMVVAAVLVFWMQAGFALIEAGFTRAKNIVNIMMKNMMDFSLGSLAFFAVGFAFMFGRSSGFIGTDGFFLQGYEGDARTYAFLLFQTVFCGTAATIVSGAMAERTRFSAYLLCSLMMTAFIYPVFGGWVWGSAFAGNGWLQGGEGSPLADLGLPPFLDFAGSTVVHSVGGWAALAGALALGPRLGKYDTMGRPRPILGHSMALATLGGFILWMGWFGFNAGSTTGVTGPGDDPFGATGKSFALIAVNTNLAACAGAVTAMFASWRVSGAPDIGLSINGALAGLVAITAGCAYVTPLSAIVIGLLAGLLVVVSVLVLERSGVDDPVGAISVHGVCGLWGTIATALFHHGGLSAKQLASQLIGAAACFVWTFSLAYLGFAVIRWAVGLRVSTEAELIGLDMTEHSQEGYPSDFIPEFPDDRPADSTTAWSRS